MPITSKAMWRALAAKKDRGELSQKTFDEFVNATPVSYRELPERVKRPNLARARAKAKRKA